MEGGERKEEALLPPDYVSLAQLQERWLQKQEEMKRKQKQEEEEKRERDSWALKQKQEEDERRERDARAQNERNRNQREGAKMRPGSVRARGVIQEKGKEIVLGGPGDGGENNKKIGKKGRKPKKGWDTRGAAAVEVKEKVGAEAEVLSGGGAGVLSGEGGSGGGSSRVKEVGCVSVVEVLPRSGEIVNVKRTDLRGGFKKNGRDNGSPRVNKLKQSEVVIDLEKEEDGGKGGGKKWNGRGGERGRGGEEERERGIDGRGRGGERGEEEERGVDGRGRRRVGERGEEERERGVDGRGRVGERRKEERGVDGRGRRRGGERREEERERGVDGRGRGGERGEEEGRERGVDGRGRGKGGERGEEEERERGVDGRGRGGDRGRGRGRGRGRRRGGQRGKNGGDPERKINMLKECRPVVLEGTEVDLKLENKADQDEISEVCSEIASLRVGDRNEIWGGENRAKEDGAEGEGSNSAKVADEIEKKVDHRVLARKEENGGSWTRYRANGIGGRDNKAKEDGVEREGSNGEILAVQLEKKVDHEVSPRKGENRGNWRRGYRANGIRGQDNKAKEDGVEGEGSNGNKVAAEVEKKVYYKVFARNDRKGGFEREYWGNGSWRGGFGRRRRYPMPEISYDCKMKWVKKENMLDA